MRVFREALERKNEEVSLLKRDNRVLKKDFLELKDDVGSLRMTQKWKSEGVTSSSPPHEPAATKQKPDPKTTAMYTPKDMETLRKTYKAAVEGKYMAEWEVVVLKERILRVCVHSAPKTTARRSVGRRTTPRSLKTTFVAVEVEDDSANEDDAADALGEPDPDSTMLGRLHEKEKKKLRSLKKTDMEKICTEEGISYIKLEQAKLDIAKIRAGREFHRQRGKGQAENEPNLGDDEEDQPQYATSAEEVQDE
ncbi:hypothetical protein CBR_g22964 [Chara braunii]|uniref:Uncharacterized protein n=1 Tax=Chara braunii TaxID=69332 RepID=A0A388L3B6_CHABU|nr:hypothetical protein CBR_g22964 [Chara braunii]|eukprot:GBG76748.1 hypothetical protein CBR_g22964 [Chara braunii]